MKSHAPQPETRNSIPRASSPFFIGFERTKGRKIERRRFNFRRFNFPRSRFTFNLAKSIICFQENLRIDSKPSISILVPVPIDPSAMFYPLLALVNFVLFFCLGQSGMSTLTQHFQLKPILLHVSEHSQPRRCTITIISSLVRNQSLDSGQITSSQLDSHSATIDPALCGQLLHEPGRFRIRCFASKSISCLSSLDWHDS